VIKVNILKSSELQIIWQREIRPTKLKQKISGCFRTFHGAEIYAKVEGNVSTLRKNHIGIFNEISLVFDGKNSKFNCLT